MIKLLGCLFMLIDHIGLMFFPQQVMLRMIGRLSMPLYAYCIARGMRYTHNLKMYVKRILAVAIVSQIPYILMVREAKLNICFLWIEAIIFIWAYESLESCFKRFFVMGGIILAVIIIPLDYGLYGLLYVVILYAFAFQKNDIKIYFAWLVLHIIKFMIDMQSGVLQLFTLPTIAIIDICNRCQLESRRGNSKIITWFYPVHITILLILYVFDAII